MEQTSLEIERKFLISCLPSNLDENGRSEILQGYLVQDSTQEVRVRLKDDRCYLTVKKGTGLTRGEVELPISRNDFDAMWPFTEGRRLEKTRYAHPHEGLTIEIDVYRGDLAPLQIAEVEFPSVETSRVFEPPEYFGSEVTGIPEYSNASLAIHGAPCGSSGEYCIGALPYTARTGEIEIVIVTNTSGSGWIVPRGKPEPDLARQEVAVIEAAEEAGVIGILEPGTNAECRLQDGRILHLYPVKISTLLKKWPESTVRKRALLPLKHALERINDKPLAECIEGLAGRLT
jgi:adenylate cyclase